MKSYLCRHNNWSASNDLSKLFHLLFSCLPPDFLIFKFYLKSCEPANNLCMGSVHGDSSTGHSLDFDGVVVPHLNAERIPHRNSFAGTASHIFMTRVQTFNFNSVFGSLLTSYVL